MMAWGWTWLLPGLGAWARLRNLRERARDDGAVQRHDLPGAPRRTALAA
jgi:hypothetical protein